MVDTGAAVQNIFKSMPTRFISERVDPSFKARLGFDIAGDKWTIEIEDNSCEVFDDLKDDCDAVVQTGADEWIGIATETADPIFLLLSKRLSVEGDIEKASAALSVFEIWESTEIPTKEPSWVIETLGENFSVREDGHFMIEEMDCAELAKEYGTPLFVTSEAQIRQNIRRMKHAFESAYPENECNVMWAIKSNTTLAFRSIMNQEGAGGDCFTPGEIYATFLTGADPEKFLLNGSDRNKETFGMAIDVGMRITLDHIDDLYMVEEMAKERGTTVRVLIRIRCELPSLEGVNCTFYPILTIPLEVLNTKWGVAYAEAVEIAEAAKRCPHVEIEGIHSHIGRDIHLPEHWRAYARDMIAFCSRFRSDTGITPSIVDLGGGIAEIRDPSSHDLSRLAAPVEDYASEVGEGIREGCAQNDFPFPRLWVEPGRNLIGSTTVMISRVGNVKRTPGVGAWVHVDASCNSLPSVLRHNGMSYHLLPGTRATAKAEETVDIVGPNCSGDLIQPRRKMPRLERGDLLVFLDVGAYNQVAANQFNSIPRPASVLVCGKRAEVICERETVPDLFAHQRIPARLLASG